MKEKIEIIVYGGLSKKAYITCCILIGVVAVLGLVALGLTGTLEPK